MGNVYVGRDFTLYWATGTDADPLYRKVFASGTPFGLVNRLTYTVDEGTEAYRGAGRRTPWGIKPGAKEITITLEGLWVDSGIQGFFLNQSKSTGALTSFVLGASGTDTSITFSGCYLTSFEGSIESDGWVTGTIELLAIDME